MDEFHIGPYMTAIQDAEILTEVRIPVKPGAGSAHEKVERRAGDWAIVAVSAALWVDGGTISDAGVALSAVGPTTIHATRSEDALKGQKPSEELFAEAGKLAVRGLQPERGQPRSRGLQAPPRRRADQAGAGARRRTRTETGGLMQVTVKVNGKDYTEDIEPALLLVHFLRDTLGLTGTHWGCDTSNCGACVVQMDGHPVKSCTTLAASCEGHEIRTIESMEVDGRLDPVQQGFHEEHALQCGFCTPGMVMTARALLDENPDPSEEEIRTAISGAICRCTGYSNIVRAVRWAAEHDGAEARR